MNENSNLNKNSITLLTQKKLKYIYFIHSSNLKVQFI